jgi:hypothetical protein
MHCALFPISGWWAGLDSRFVAQQKYIAHNPDLVGQYCQRHHQPRREGEGRTKASRPDLLRRVGGEREREWPYRAGESQEEEGDDGVRLGHQREQGPLLRLLAGVQRVHEPLPPALRLRPPPRGLPRVPPPLQGGDLSTPACPSASSVSFDSSPPTPNPSVRSPPILPRLSCACSAA